MVSLHRNHNLFVESLPKKKKATLALQKLWNHAAMFKKGGGGRHEDVTGIKTKYFFQQEQKGERQSAWQVIKI